MVGDVDGANNAVRQVAAEFESVIDGELEGRPYGNGLVFGAVTFPDRRTMIAAVVVRLATDQAVIKVERGVRGRTKTRTFHVRRDGTFNVSGIVKAVRG